MRYYTLIVFTSMFLKDIIFVITENNNSTVRAVGVRRELRVNSRLHTVRSFEMYPSEVSLIVINAELWYV